MLNFILGYVAGAVPMLIVAAVMLTAKERRELR